MVSPYKQFHRSLDKCPEDRLTLLAWADFAEEQGDLELSSALREVYEKGWAPVNVKKLDYISTRFSSQWSEGDWGLYKSNGHGLFSTKEVIKSNGACLPDEVFHLLHDNTWNGQYFKRPSSAYIKLVKAVIKHHRKKARGRTPT